LAKISVAIPRGAMPRQQAPEAWSRMTSPEDLPGYNGPPPLPPSVSRSPFRNIGSGGPDGTPAPMLLNSGQRPHTAAVNGRAEGRKESKVDPLSGEEAENLDAFTVLMRQLSSEHSNQLALMKQENDELKKQLNTVLTATWGMHDDGQLHGNNPNSATALRLRSAEWQGKALVKSGHEVPEDIVNGYRKKPAPTYFDLRERWLTGRQRKESLGFSKEDDDDDVKNFTDTQSEHSEVRAESCMGRVIIHPASSRLVIWDTIGTFFLVYDLIMVPVGAFDPDQTAFLTVMSWCTLLFWTCDMFMASLTGYNERGHAILAPRRVFNHYLRSWFPLDFIVVVPDWIFTIIGHIMADDSGTNATKLLRSVRLMRGIRLLRLAKLKRLITVVKDAIENEMMFKAFDVMVTVSCLLFANHLLGSLWYATGRFYQDEGLPNWIDDMRIKDDVELSYRYMTSLQWATTHFTLGQTRVEPQNTLERVFATVMLVVGMIFFAGFVSNITVTMLALRETQRENQRNIRLLRRYLRQNHVSAHLKYRVLRYADFHIQDNKTHQLSEENVGLLKQLSDGLRTEVRFEASFPRLLLHPLFERGLFVSKQTVQNLTNTALSHKVYAVNDNVFRPGLWAEEMFVVESGELFYQHKVMQKNSRFTVTEGDWACEQTLWVSWMTQGKLKAAQDCRVIACNAEAVSEAFKSDPVLMSLCSKYAKRFVEWLNEVAITPDDLRDIMQGEESRLQAHEFMLDSHFDEVPPVRKSRMSHRFG